jgi:hypothetical protein
MILFGISELKDEMVHPDSGPEQGRNVEFILIFIL